MQPPIEFVPIPPTNKHSIISLILGILTILTFCGGLAPIPFTGFICFPSSFILGVLAIIYGIIALNRTRRDNESGRPMAWIGILVGGIIFLCMLAIVAAFIFFFIFHPHTFQLPPIFDKHQL